MNKEWNESVIRQDGRAVYEADPTLKPFDDLTEEKKTGYYLQAQAALKAAIFLRGLYAELG